LEFFPPSQLTAKIKPKSWIFTTGAFNRGSINRIHRNSNSINFCQISAEARTGELAELFMQNWSIFGGF
jgi:hypothetical protein